MSYVTTCVCDVCGKSERTPEGAGKLDMPKYWFQIREEWTTPQFTNICSLQCIGDWHTKELDKKAQQDLRNAKFAEIYAG